MDGTLWDIDEKAVKIALQLLNKTHNLSTLLVYNNKQNRVLSLKNIITREDRFTFTICNPPFHKSLEEATKGTIRKVSNLESKKTANPVLNLRS
jgi:23S rRNA (adenine1618-N6)-methyltransferase